MSSKKIFVTVFFAATISVFSQKTVHLKIDSLINMMPETKTARELAQNYLSDLEKIAKRMDTELQDKYNEYTSMSGIMSDLIKKTKEDELQSLQKRLENFKAQAQQDYQKRSAELTAPIMAKANKAIEAVAKENGYKYVLDTRLNYILYADPSGDILMAVKKKLDTMPLAVIPGEKTPAEKNKNPEQRK